MIKLFHSIDQASKEDKKRKASMPTPTTTTTTTTRLKTTTTPTAAAAAAATTTTGNGCTYKLVIGNKNYSSWSLRAWLHLKKSGIEFEEIRIPLYTDNYKSKLLEHSPAGRVPILIDQTCCVDIDIDGTCAASDGGGGGGGGGGGYLSIWDSMSIIEYIVENGANVEATASTAAAAAATNVIGWPTNKVERAVGRSICYEMHSGFLCIRDELPQNVRAKHTLNMETKLSPSCRQQIQRIDDIWKHCITKYADKKNGSNVNDGSSRGGSGNPTWLFGGTKTMTIPDIVYAPVALRFVTYGIQVSEESRRYISMVVNDPHVQEWIEAAKLEPESLEFIDNLIPASDSPLVL